jgi:hypothetical protein
MDQTRHCTVCVHPMAKDWKFCEGCGSAARPSIPIPTKHVAPRSLRRLVRGRDPAVRTRHKLQRVFNLYGCGDGTGGGRASRYSKRALPGTEGLSDFLKRSEASLARHRARLDKQEELLDVMEMANAVRYENSQALVNEWSEHVRIHARKRLKEALTFSCGPESTEPPASADPEHGPDSRTPDVDRSADRLLLADDPPVAEEAPPKPRSDPKSFQYLRPGDLERRPRPLEGEADTEEQQQSKDDPSRRIFDGTIVLRPEDIERRSAWFWGMDVGAPLEATAVFWGSAHRQQDSEDEGEAEHDGTDDATTEAIEPASGEPAVTGAADPEAKGDASGTDPRVSARDVWRQASAEPPTLAEDCPMVTEKEKEVFSLIHKVQCALEEAIKTEIRLYGVLHDVTLEGTRRKAASSLIGYVPSLRDSTPLPLTLVPGLVSGQCPAGCQQVFGCALPDRQAPQCTPLRPAAQATGTQKKLGYRAASGERCLSGADLNASHS